MPDGQTIGRTVRVHRALCPAGAWLGPTVSPSPCTCPPATDYDYLPGTEPWRRQLRCTTAPVFEETPMPVETPASYRRAVDQLETVPDGVTFWLELTRLDDGIATFTSAQHAAEVRLPLTEWASLGRPGHIETTTLARVA